MLSDEIRKKLQDIVRGNVLTGQKDRCTKIRNLLCKSFIASPTVKKEFESRAIIKKEQASYLIDYAKSEDLFLSALPEGTRYLTRGGEAEIFLAEDHKDVIKVK